MWITTTAGFYSAVQVAGDPAHLSVRTRDLDSIRMLKDGIETLTGVEVVIREREGTDYPYRVTVSRDHFAQWVAFEIQEYITYTNFKNKVHDVLGSKWSDTLNKVWVNMLDVTDDNMKDHGYAGSAFPVNPHYADYRDEEYR